MKDKALRETNNLEFKKDITNTFLKTVSAFANYGTGQICFGVLDDGTPCGINNPIKVCLDIENRINDSLTPTPSYSLSIDQETNVITLTVQEGLHKPYLYKSKAFKRNDSSTIEVDRLELTRLILEGENINFEELDSKQQDLTFDYLTEALKREMSIQNVNLDVLKTLQLYNSHNRYNVAASLLSDNNTFSGIDVVRFGQNISTILDRETYVHCSVIKQYDNVLELFKKYYQYEVIEGSLRETKELIPLEAFREVIANALVHRTWDVNAHITVSMYDNRIEVVSPGGLPEGIREDEFIIGGLSVPRNYIICNVFMRLHMIERFGTGIRRIHDLYKDNRKKPLFEITSQMIKIVLPVISSGDDLEGEYRAIYDLIKGSYKSSSQIIAMTGIKKTKALKILNDLMEEGYIRKEGIGRGTKYIA